MSFREVQVVEKVVEVPQLGSTTQGSVREAGFCERRWVGWML